MRFMQRILDRSEHGFTFYHENLTNPSFCDFALAQFLSRMVSRWPDRGLRCWPGKNVRSSWGDPHAKTGPCWPSKRPFEGRRRKGWIPDGRSARSKKGRNEL